VILKLEGNFYLANFKQVTIQTPLSCENILLQLVSEPAFKKLTHPTVQMEKDPAQLKTRNGIEGRKVQNLNTQQCRRSKKRKICLK